MTVVQELEQEIAVLPVSSPVFNISTHHNGWSGQQLQFTLIDKVGYFPSLELDHQKFPMRSLARQCHYERLDHNIKQFVIDEVAVKHRAMDEVRRSVKHFIGTHMEDEVLYKWYDYYVFTGRMYEGTYFEPMLGIYKYIMTHLKDEDVDKHVTNATAILELIFQRDYKETHIPQRRKRRRRK